MTYTPEQIAELLASIKPGAYTACASMVSHEVDGYVAEVLMIEDHYPLAKFFAAAPAIVKQQADRIKELEVTMREIEHGARLASDPGRAHSCQISFDELLSNFGSLADSARCALAPGADHAALLAAETVRPPSVQLCDACGEPIIPGQHSFVAERHAIFHWDCAGNAAEGDAHETD